MTDAQAANEPVAWKVKSSNGKSVFFEDRPNWHIENGYEVQQLYPTSARERPGAQAASEPTMRLVHMNLLARAREHVPFMGKRGRP